MNDQRPICLSCYRFALVNYWLEPIANGYCEPCFNFFSLLAESGIMSIDDGNCIVASYDLGNLVELGVVSIDGGTSEVYVDVIVTPA